MEKNKFEYNRKFYFFIYKIYHYFFSEKFNKKINFQFDASKSRNDLVVKTIKKKKYTKYLEIGCDQDQLFGKIDIDYKIGVDPEAGGNFRGTSDNFFKQNSDFFDCIFIDGLHEYHQVIKDIKNSINFLNQDGVIILHDCLPDSISKQLVPRSRYSWNGDVWKAIAEVRTWTNFDTCTCLIDQGVSVIKKRKNEDILDLDVTRFDKLTYRFFYENYSKLMRLKSFEDTLNFI